jgi:lysophospholipase L1-like esterase
MEFPRKTFLAILTLIAIVVALEYVPALSNYRLLDWDAVRQVADFHPSKAQTPDPIATAELNLKPGKVVVAKGARLAVEPLTDPAHSLDAFFDAIEQAETADSTAQVRIAHYGDSPTTADLITADIRDLLQKRFGDSGHGFYLIAKPWAWYGHRGILSDSSGWDIFPSNSGVSRPRDGLFGYGGVSFQGSYGARARFKLATTGYDRVEVAYWQQPNGGNFQLTACGTPLADTPTAGEPQEAFQEFPISSDCREVVLTATSTNIRLFGIQFRRPERGLIYDSLGLNGAYISVLSTFINADHLARQLQHYNPDLIVINYGTNESVYAAFVDKVFEGELREAIRRIRSALPQKSILLMSPMDRGERNASGQIETVPALQRLVGIEARVAAAEGVAFFNTFEAMGGNGTMAKWYGAEPRLVGADFIHPMPAGAKIIGNLLYKAILDSYNRHKTSKRASQAP